jgi:phosphopantothenoylcysteine synthetase/decarboxylase
MKVLITSGGTKVKIDDVRHIGNMSSGKFGAELAVIFTVLKNQVIYLGAKNSPVKPSESEDFVHIWGTPTIQEHEYEDYFDYLEKSVALVKQEKPNVIISAAAVSDFIVDKVDGKISSDNDEMIIKLKKAQKVLPLLKAASPSSMVVGFKLLVSPSFQEVSKAVQKTLDSGADYVVYNDLTEIKKGNPARLVFNKNMQSKEVLDARELTHYIINEYLTWSNGQCGY